MKMRDKLTFGKYKDYSINEVMDIDKDYLIWLYDNKKVELQEPVLGYIQWASHCKKTGFGSNAGVTNDDCTNNN